MFKSVFSRLFIIYLIITLLSLILLGILVSQILRSQYLEQEKKQLQSDMDTVKEYAQRAIEQQITSYAFTNQLLIKASRDNTVITVLNSDGRYWLTADPQKTGVMDQSTVQYEIINAYNSIKGGGPAPAVSIFNNDTGTQAITIGIPIISGGTVSGAIFIYSDLKDLDKSLGAVTGQLVNSAVISMLLALILVYTLSRYMVKDITKISVAAKKLSKGDFTTRVSIKSKNEVGQLASTFNDMAEDLQKLEGLRISFVANVSHELRTPLTSIQGFVQGILDGAIKPEEQETYLNTVLSETKRLNLLITDLLELSKVESGKFPLNMRIFDINELMRRCLITFEHAIDKKELEVDVLFTGERLYVNADPDRIAQVVTNLLDNAVKFSRPKGRLTLRTQVYEDKVYASVKDTGEGIPQKDLPFIFEQFYKVDKSRGRKVQGTGIGLSIVKKIMDQHGEKIWVESKPGEGSVFTFSLKVEK
jgi:signal transduction histidine kinase/uncharacterized membrane-anchored protein YhcB (DUF1043 family)